MKKFLYLNFKIMLVGLVVFACTPKDGDINKNYDGTKVEVTVEKPDSDYKYKVTVKYAENMVAVKYYCDQVMTPTMNEWIKLCDCKNFNGDLYIPYNNMKWFTYEEQN